MELILIFTFLLFADLQSPSAWRGIVPLHSSRADVEQVLGPPSRPTGSTFYDFEAGSVFVVYATGPPCGEHGENEWRVARDTVISLTVYSKRKPKFSERTLDMKKYKRTGGGHLPGVYYYVNNDDGIKIEVVQGRVDAITYFPAAKDDHLHCPRIVDATGHDVSGELSPKEKELLDRGSHCQ